MINDKDKIKMFEMRTRGCTLAEIGEMYGITRERVRQILKSAISRSTSMVRGREGIIYPNISKWLKDNDVSIEEFAEYLGKEQNFKKKKVTRLSHILKGKGEFTMQEILAVLKVTRMTFEQAFKTIRRNKHDTNN
ncbi:XRE family transcriptional regulator [Clostridium botulinum]|uniref:sigma factor-like helix-turn-helix DNA-binding protein n=1 Tax=unclassified Clostridium TaxID=2614128 RepID=UPI0013C646C6|nr:MULTISPECIES: sigma factor-like helix-turn-helix DNA-binding protein [unclassified Clostridium]MBY7007906.1 XRE family transcriptional regulator [Clostridium botulinum]NFG31428.1 XRE family transcriptional regulator [Clostridium botulinum]NFH72693.1 XRE family transcriptional regulator [Clostridium botulinum]NFI00888.1 XRE family transcriptional regulator [Clostridium botulinum]NFI62964.1 XRE family transcriptional regulator [Clostridium botulinum]